MSEHYRTQDRMRLLTWKMTRTLSFLTVLRTAVSFHEVTMQGSCFSTQTSKSLSIEQSTVFLACSELDFASSPSPPSHFLCPSQIQLLAQRLGTPWFRSRSSSSRNALHLICICHILLVFQRYPRPPSWKQSLLDFQSSLPGPFKGLPFSTFLTL